MTATDTILTFLENTKFTMANYQFVVLGELINNKNKARIEDVLKALNKVNKKHITFSNTPVFKVLTKKGFIKIKDDLIIANFPIMTNADKQFANSEIRRIMKFDYYKR